MDTHTIFIIGKPGCGKGVQTKILSDRTSWPIISSGNLFREIAQEDSPVGQKVKAALDAGILQPHWFAMYLFLKKLFSLPAGANAIFDGFNRKVPESDLAIDALRWLDRPFSMVYLRVSDEEVRRRLDGRRIEEGRADDLVVDERLKEYRIYTEPAIEKFRDAGKLIEINGEQKPEKIADDICEALHLPCRRRNAQW